jgi:hypothetical protein
MTLTDSHVSTKYSLAVVEKRGGFCIFCLASAREHQHLFAKDTLNRHFGDRHVKDCAEIQKDGINARHQSGPGANLKIARAEIGPDGTISIVIGGADAPADDKANEWPVGAA